MASTVRERVNGWPFRLTVLALLIVALIAVLLTRDPATTRVATAPDISPTPEPSGTAVPPTPVPTTAALAAPTPQPSPTAFVLPEPTPAFGPTGRPAEAGEVAVLTAKSYVRRPTVFDAPNGTEVEVSYTYLDGTVDPVYDHFTNPTYFNNPLALMVVRGSQGDEWAEVTIPTRPTTTGWVRTADFDWSTSDYYVRVNIGNNTIKVWRGDEILVDSTPVVTGDTGRATPVASTYIDEIMRGPSAAYGPWLLSLGVFSESINTFGGGLPKVALHGTNQPSLLGQYASNGCIRLPNDVITLLANEVPVGTRVDLVNEP